MGMMNREQMQTRMHEMQQMMGQMKQQHTHQGGMKK